MQRFIALTAKMISELSCYVALEISIFKKISAVYSSLYY